MSAFGRSGKDVNLALALASGSSQVAAAEQLRISTRTIRRKMAQPQFRGLIAEFRDQFIAQALGRLADNMTRAADSFVTVLNSEREELRLRAARGMLSLGLRLRDSVELTERIRQIEAELACKLSGAA
jgi:hypothetical protein